jgi:hypothetical protein
LKALANRASRHGVFLVLAGANPGVSREIAAHHAANSATLAPDMKAAIALAREAIN